MKGRPAARACQDQSAVSPEKHRQAAAVVSFHRAAATTKAGQLTNSSNRAYKLGSCLGGELEKMTDEAARLVSEFMETMHQLVYPTNPSLRGS